MLRILFTILILGLSACTLNLPQSTPTLLPEATMLVSTGTIVSLDGTQWLLQSYIDLKGNLLDVLPGTEITISFQNAQVVGAAGCNRYFAEYQLQIDRLAFTPFSITEKYCTGPEGLMDQERQYLQTLGTVKRFKIVDGRLQLLDVGGQTVLTYTPLAK
jgi:heat shock protein HslJ